MVDKVRGQGQRGRIFIFQILQKMPHFISSIQQIFDNAKKVKDDWELKFDFIKKIYKVWHIRWSFSPFLS